MGLQMWRLSLEPGSHHHTVIGENMLHVVSLEYMELASPGALWEPGQNTYLKVIPPRGLRELVLLTNS